MSRKNPRRKAVSIYLTFIAAGAAACSTNAASNGQGLAEAAPSMPVPAASTSAQTASVREVKPASASPTAPAVAAQAGAEANAPQALAEKKQSGKVFVTEPVSAGYQRFEPPAIEVPAGDSDDWAQFVGGPLDQDYDVIDIKGQQSIGGHHALVYATTTEERPGTTRLWKEEDQITSRLMGGIGGEGGANVQFPPGVVFRVKKGSYILIQTHYLNPTDAPMLGRTVIDIHLEPVDPSRIVASMMSSTSTAIKLPAHLESSKDIECMVEKDLKFLQISNHMHDYGKAQVSDYVAPDGSVHVLKDDQSWVGELALNPNFTKYTVETAVVVPKGSLLRTHCTWNNTTDKEVTFPTEMCVFFGFILNANDVYCTTGKWSESTSFADPTATQPGTAMNAITAAAGAPAPTVSQASAGAAGAAGAAARTGAAGAAGTGTAANGPTTAVGCTSMADQDIMNAAAFDKQSTDCATPCALDPDTATCAAPCFEKQVGLSHACAQCNADNIACGAKKCLSACLSDSASPACRSCVMTNCDPAFRKCTGT